MLRLSTKLNSLVFTVLRGQTPPTGSWTRLTKSGCAIGLTGQPTSTDSTLNWTLFSEGLKTEKGLTSLVVSPDMSVKGMQVEEIKSELARFKQRFAPSGRPLNWIADATPYTRKGPMAPTGDI